MSSAHDSSGGSLVSPVDYSGLGHGNAYTLSVLMCRKSIDGDVCLNHTLLQDIAGLRCKAASRQSPLYDISAGQVSGSARINSNTMACARCACLHVAVIASNIVKVIPAIDRVGMRRYK